ncbi:MAG TPA: PDZ domain-containing protein, partial [Polyangia bacterium]
VAAQKVGAKLTLALLRDGKASKSQVTLAELPANPYALGEAQVKKERIGAHMQTLTPEMAGALGIAPDTQGAVVTEVEPNSQAAKAGLHPEDVIVEVDRKPVAGAEDAAAALHAAGKPTHLLKVCRAGTFLFVTVPGN